MIACDIFGWLLGFHGIMVEYNQLRERWKPRYGAESVCICCLTLRTGYFSCKPSTQWSWWRFQAQGLWIFFSAIRLMLIDRNLTAPKAQLFLSKWLRCEWRTCNPQFEKMFHCLYNWIESFRSFPNEVVNLADALGVLCLPRKTGPKPRSLQLSKRWPNRHWEAYLDTSQAIRRGTRVQKSKRMACFGGPSTPPDRLQALAWKKL